ncbi:MAG: RluA family pseudouridine synthase, partial [Clostridiales bacterium]
LINLLTGRTHQIRVHFSYWGFPLAGDSLYGGDLTDIKRQALCCTRVMFAHPSTDKQMDISIDIQEDMKLLI